MRLSQRPLNTRITRRPPDHEETMNRQWMCAPCGLIYDESLGMPEHGIAAGTPFDAIPDDWVCPDCGVGKDDFYLIPD
jgi:rubredoxin